MPREPDPIWKHVKREEHSKWKCLFCGIERSGGATRIRAHLAGTLRYGITACEKVDQHVRAEALQTINAKGSVLDTSTGGTSGEGTEIIVIGTSQNALQSDDASNPNDMQNSHQPGCAPQQPSCNWSTGTNTALACPQDQVSLPPSDMPLDNLDNTQQSHPSNWRLDAAHGNENASSLQPLSSLYVSEPPTPPEPSTRLDFGTGTAPACPRDALPPGDMHLDNLDNTQQSDPSNCRLDSEHGTENASSCQQLLMNSSPSPSLDFSEQRVLRGGEVILDSLVDSTENLHCSPPENPPELPDAIANASEEIGLQEHTGELDMNGDAPMTSHPNTVSNLEENRALKRKLKLLYSKEADVRDELKFAASLFLKKPRKEVAKWLADVEKVRIDCPAAASEDCLPPYQQVDILMREAEDLSRQGKGLFEVRETKVSKLLEEKMVGEAFHRNTTKILEYLVGNRVSRLGIYGMGGVGKTTIMVHIHNRLLEKANYGNVLWITVSQDFNTEKLQDAIWKELGSGILLEKDVRKRAAILHDCLMKSGKSTIILDGVWEHVDLKEVGIPVGVDGIKLVLTTRSFEVCRQMQCQEMIKIKCLSDIEAESLFLEELTSEAALNLEIEAVVKSIVKECAGLPLAVITMARSMRHVANVFEWKDCLEKLRGSNMGQTVMEKQVLMKLEFSYSRLCDREIQQCFLSCALYPEDGLIDKFELIEFFIDQGLIGQLNTREKQYDRGLNILQKLVNACLLEDQEGKMKMHNLIRDMALHIMSGTSIVEARTGLERIPSEEYWTDVLEKVSLMENDIKEFPLNMSPNCPKLSTFLLNRNFRDDLVIPDSFFKHLSGLKVLNLSGCRLKELPDSISDLVNLTALLLRECFDLCRIPRLGKLRSLRKLDIYHCDGVEVLEGLDMLVNLRYLDITCTRMEKLPKGISGALNLQCLAAKLVNGEEITKLRALETLDCFFDNVDDFNKFVRVFSERTNDTPYYRIIVGNYKSFERKSVCALLQNRERSVHIATRSHTIVSARGESSGSGNGICILIPQDVRKLTAWNCNGATNLSDMGPLEELEVLQIRQWNNLRVLCGGQDEELINIHDSPTRTPTPLLFGSLRDLEISECPKLKYLFGHGPKFSLPYLRSIQIVDCVEMVGITMATTSPPPYPPPTFPSLEEIMVWRCDKMKRVVEFEWLPHFPNLRLLGVSGFENMEEIIGGLSSYMSVEENFPQRPSVEGCHDLPLHLRNLQTIQVIRCEGMVEMISGAGQGQEGSMTTLVNNTPSSSQSSISLPKLNVLWLYMLPQLKSICEVPITCNSMGYLAVIGCPKLNRIPLKMQLRDIEDLPYIEVEGEEKWKTVIDIISFIPDRNRKILKELSSVLLYILYMYISLFIIQNR